MQPVAECRRKARISGSQFPRQRHHTRHTGKWDGFEIRPTERRHAVGHVVQVNPAGVGHQVVLIGPDGVGAEEIVREALARAVHFQATRPCLFQRPAFARGHALDTPLARRHQPHMKGIRRVAEQLSRAAPHQDDAAARRRLLHRLFEAVNVMLMRRMQPKAVGQAQRLFVETFQVGVGNVLHGGGLMQQFAVEQFPA